MPVRIRPAPLSTSSGESTGWSLEPISWEPISTLLVARPLRLLSGSSSMSVPVVSRSIVSVWSSESPTLSTVRSTLSASSDLPKREVMSELQAIV